MAEPAWETGLSGLPISELRAISACHFLGQDERARYTLFTKSALFGA